VPAGQPGQAVAAICSEGCKHIGIAFGRSSFETVFDVMAKGGAQVAPSVPKLYHHT
jgi:hypothetical protein